MGAYDQETINGISAKQSTEMSSMGFMFGFEDVTMFNVSKYQIGWIAGLLFSLATPSDYSVDGQSATLKDAAGFGINVTAGLRFGMDQFFAQLAYKVDISFGVATDNFGTALITGLGVGGIFVSGGYYF